MKKDKIYLLIILILSSIFLLLEKKYYLGDDTLFHTSNIIANNLPLNKITPTLLNNLGYGINIFYPPLPHLLGTIFYKITNNINITIKLLQWLSIFLSGLTMYIYIKVIFKKEETALITSLFYISMPYLFTDVFTRGALNESFLFYLLPIIFLSYHYLLAKNDKLFYILFILGFTLSIYTHLVLTIYITIFSIIYLLIFYKKILTKNNIIKLIKSTIIVLSITSIFWLPLVEHYLLKNYYVFSINYTKENMVHTLPLYYYFFPLNVLSGAKNPLKLYTNTISLFYLIFTYLTFFKQEEAKNTKIIVSLIIITIISLILESTKLIWNIIPNILRNIQFSWRLSIITSFTISIISGYGINLFKHKKIPIIITIILLTIMNIYNIKTLPNKEYTTTLDTNCCQNNWQQEYLPISSIKRLDYLSHHSKDIISDTNIKIIENTNKTLTFKVNNIDKLSEIELPRIYYLGYTLTKDNKKINLKQNENGLISASIKEKGLYTLKYEKTTLNKISYIIALIGLIAFLKNILKK